MLANALNDHTNQYTTKKINMSVKKGSRLGNKKHRYEPGPRNDKNKYTGMEKRTLSDYQSKPKYQ